MLEHASGQFTIEGNVEDIFGGVSGAARIARISQTCLFTGSLQGESIAEYTAVLPREGDGSFQGFQRISGALADREGSFVVRVIGEYAKGQPRGSWEIVPKSGSGDFLHIRGNGSFSQSAGKAGKFELEFDLRKPRKARDAASFDERDADELVPGIDIAADDELAPESEAAIASSEPASLESRPVRRSRKKQGAIEPADYQPPAVESTPPSKRPRTKPVPPAIEVVDEMPRAESAPPRKRSRKAAPPVVAPEAPVTAEPAPKPRRKRAAPVEVVSEETQSAANAPRTRARKTAVIEETQPVTAEPVPATDSKPPRRKKTPSLPPEPMPLPIAQDKPTRRKAQAA